MANDTILTDDYVAGLLAKEASDASVRYSSMGLEAFGTAKPANKAKPNTRFLGRIIKETTSHNAALLAKEAAEAQARLDNLTEADNKRRQRLNPSAGDIRKRQLGDISSILLGRKRKRGGEDERHGPPKADGAEPTSEKDHKRRDGRHRSGKHEERVRDRRSERRTRDGRGDRDRSRSPMSRPRLHRQRSPLSGDEHSGDDRRRKSHKRESEQGRKQPRADLFGGGLSKRKQHGRLLSDEDTGPSTSEDKDLFAGSLTASNSRHGRLSEDDGSDPLEDLIGPSLPPQSPVRRRGRGAGRSSAAMDARFSDSYDPQSDIQPNGDDWDNAVEEFRDRQKWKQQGAARLRAAGFAEEEITKWERGGGERDHNDVRWSKAGEGREWDRGKDV